MINYTEIEKLLDETLEKETPESLKTWLDAKKKEEYEAECIEEMKRFVEPDNTAYITFTRT